MAGKATPALAEVIGRLSQERSESSVGEVLRREHHVPLASETVCLIRDAVARGIAGHLEDEQVRVLLEMIRAGQAQGRVILSAGRDGIFVPLRGAEDNRWKEAAVGTVSVDVKPVRGELRRLGTVYLGQMPQPGQDELSDHLTSLLRRVLSDDCARNLRLVYLTDAGHHPQEYFQRVLRNMDYASYRAEHLPIGSGVTEAACKTVFTQRFKCSGMIWNRDKDYDHRDPEATITGARSVLILRLAVLSRVWPAVFQAFLATKTINAKSIVNSQLAS